MNNNEIITFTYQLITEPLLVHELKLFNDIKDDFIHDMRKYDARNNYHIWEYGTYHVEFEIVKNYNITNVIIKTCFIDD